MTVDPSDDKDLEFDALLRAGVHEALGAREFPAAFEAFLSALPRLAPQFAAEIPPGTERPMGLALFREIWNHTPRPDLGWKRLTLPRPERNRPCPCGSGRKYKQCCASLEGGAPFPSEGFSVLSYVLETVPVAGFGALPFKQFDPEEVAHVASTWRADGRIEAATSLLEAQLAAGNKLDARHEAAFDTLCDLYLDAGRDDDRIALVERAMHWPDKHLRGAALQRSATQLADRGDYTAAWKAFADALRLDPDNPALAHLEIVLLASQGRNDEMQARAAFWERRLIGLGYGGEKIVELMAAVARDPEMLHAMFAEHGGNEDEFDVFAEVSLEDFEALRVLADDLPEPVCHYRLSPQGDSAGPLEAAPELDTLEAAWSDMRWARDEDADPWCDTGWLAWLRKHPLAWQSFSVVEDVIGIIDDGRFPDAVGEAVERMLLALSDHAVALLRCVLADNAADGLKLEWGWMANRPALRLLMRAADNARYAEAEIPLLEWLVLRLNPNDNGGHRERLVHAYCEAGRAADALALCDRFADDMLAGTRYGRVLALYLLGRRGDAVAALAEATKRLPKVLKTLVAARPKAPPLSAGMVTHGGDDEAWMYRMYYRPTWAQCRALEWLETVAVGKTRPPRE